MTDPHSEPAPEFLAPSRCVDSDHPAIVALAAELAPASAAPTRHALTLYYWVRDEIRYNPYTAGLTAEALRASTTLERGEGWCVPKAALLAALCRAAGIPARLGYADVRNHLSTARLRASMQTDVFYYHGYCSLYLEERWVKATPAFNLALCEKFGLLPLEFNGREDSLYHPYDRAGNRHMEYLNDRGEYADVPLEEMLAVFREHYPAMLEQLLGDGGIAMGGADWEQDVARETGAGGNRSA
jgi:transglutaminase-like putative cysteine protease